MTPRALAALAAARAERKRSAELQAEAARLLAIARERRDALVLANLRVVELGILSIRARGLGSQFEVSDLRAEGTAMMLIKAEAYDPARGSFPNYVKKAVRGAMWELVRRRNFRETSHLQLLGEEVAVVEDARQSPESLADTARRGELAVEAMGVLSERERALVLRFYAGEDLGTIAREWGISQSGASKIHVGAMRKMREYFRLRGRVVA